MNSTPYLHLAWKEYRAVRLFWVAIVGLTIIGSIVAADLTSDPAARTMWIFNLALVAPVLFALGSAAAAFSAEQEEGTFDFLRAAPISSQQVLASKLSVAIIGTAAMFIVLWPVAQWFNASHFPDDVQLHNMLGLWLVAALEAIAWGTLFSLVTARPLLAVILAMTAASSAAHYFAWRMRISPNFSFEFASYLHAVPWRILAALAVLGVDIFLGRHWLEGTRTATNGLRAWSRRNIRVGSKAVNDMDEVAAKMMFQQDHGQMLGHLLWQHWRQSKWLMSMMVIVYIVLGLNVNGFFMQFTSAWLLPVGDLQVVGPMAALAALMGACVFLADQERRHFRFFVEHNIPPRYVWLTRQAAWFGTFLVSTLVICVLWLKRSDVRYFWEAVQSLTDWRQHANRDYRNINFTLPPLGLALACALVSYSAGQWCSMMIRSGIMAGFCGLILAFVLSAWASLMNSLQVNWWWSVFPIPIVLLWATWLRAPDWVRENATWGARGRAAFTIVIPAAALCLFVAYHRVHQIYWMSPGFDVAAFEAETPKEDALATGELYRKAAKAYVHPKEEMETDRPMTDAQREFLTQNAESLALELEASRRPNCALADAETFSLTWLINLSGHELEANGKLDEALDRYLSSLHVALHFGGVEGPYFKWTLQEIANWGAVKGQTPERIRDAIAKLEMFKDADQDFQRAIKNQYVGLRRWILGDKDATPSLRSNQPFATAAVIDMIMPWERQRAVRALNVVTADVLSAMQQIQSDLNAQEQSDRSVIHATIQLLPPTVGSDSWWWWVAPLDINAFESTFPSPEPMDHFGTAIAREFVEFEALRRGTIIVLALEAYRLEHGELPDSLERLQDDWNKQRANSIASTGVSKFVPLDPYSGEPFRYFPTGLPELPKQPAVLPAAADWDIGIDSTLSNIADEWKTKSIVAGVPGIWSTGPDLVGKWVEEQNYDPDIMENVKSTPHLYYWSRWPDGQQSTLPNYAAWPKGIWFPIPERKEMTEVKDR